MNLRLMLYAAMALLISMSAFAQTKAATSQPTQAMDYGVRLEANTTQILTGIQALEEQRSAATPEDRPALDRQIAALKKQGEINRLQILLDWAKAEGDMTRASELQTALDNWTAPVDQKRLPEREKGPRADANAALKTKPESK